MAQIIELVNRSGLDYLDGLVKRAMNMGPVLKEIGEDMSESTKRRFSSASAPDGTAWAPNSAVTLARYSSNFARKKDGELTKRGAAKLANKKPGTGETRALGTTINYQLQGDEAVSIGSPMVYAGTSITAPSRASSASASTRPARAAFLCPGAISRPAPSSGHQMTTRPTSCAWCAAT